VAEAIASAAATLPLQAVTTLNSPGSTNNQTLSILMQETQKALEINNFIAAKALFADLHEKMPNDVSIVHELTLATYKAKVPTEKEALEEARELLEGLNPIESTDTETLGLLQAVHKRLWSLTKDRLDLDKAIWASEKGFYLKNDYYNGINLAYLYNVRATISEEADRITDFVLAQRTRRRVVDICQALLEKSAPKQFGPGTYWILATLAEAWAGLGDEAKSQEYEDQAFALNPPPAQWMKDSTKEQLKNLRALIADSRLKSGVNSTLGAASDSK
jgi:tetratricopeptide (TPR) repeat protein